LVSPGGALVSLLEEPDPEPAQQHGIRASNNAVLPTNEILRTIAQLIAEGQIRTIVGPIFPLREAHKALALSQTGHGRGRIVLQIGGGSAEF
jgi:NADPH:quinone reductase-like Zn-dependent oxidoreductase